LVYDSCDEGGDAVIAEADAAPTAEAAVVPAVVDAGAAAAPVPASTELVVNIAGGGSVRLTISGWSQWLGTM
jgi:hypothetical protein